MSNITVKIPEIDKDLTIEEARYLYNELKELFGSDEVQFHTTCGT